MSIRDANGQKHATRIFRFEENLEEAYYSAWYYFPRTFRPNRWWNVFQFKSKTLEDESVPVWVINVGVIDDNAMAFYATDHINDGVYHQANAVPIPVGEWVHLEAYVRRSNNVDGQLTVWQNGDEILDIRDVATSINSNISGVLTTIATTSSRTM